MTRPLSSSEHFLAPALLGLFCAAVALCGGCYAPSNCQTYCERAVAGACGDTCVAVCENDRRVALATGCDESLSAAIDCAEENACVEVSVSTGRPRACRGYYAQFDRCVDVRCTAHPFQPECLPPAP